MPNPDESLQEFFKMLDEKTISECQSSLNTILTDYQSVQQQLDSAEKKSWIEVRLHQIGIRPQWAEKVMKQPNTNPVFARHQSDSLPYSSFLNQSGEEESQLVFFFRQQKKSVEFINNEHLQKIFSYFSNDERFSEAAGIPKEKGGINNIIDMMLEGQIYTKFHGPLTNIDRALSAGPHGPSYIIFATNEQHSDKLFGKKETEVHSIKTQNIEAFLVEDNSVRIKIEAALDKAVQLKLLGNTQKTKMMEKIVTYKEYADSLNLGAQPDHNSSRPTA